MRASTSFKLFKGFSSINLVAVSGYRPVTARYGGVHLRKVYRHMSSLGGGSQQSPGVGGSQQSPGVTHNSSASLASSSTGLTQQIWLVKLAAENNYLSWMRNTYLSVGAGLAFNMSPRLDTLSAMLPDIALSTSPLMYGIALFNLTYGSTQYVFRLRSLRDTCSLSLTSLIGPLGFTLLHYLLVFSTIVSLHTFWTSDGDSDIKIIVNEVEDV